ncbi:glycosyltransferase family 4 protein [Klenkia terrae]|uniref:Glycosyltransferase family 4 protein n=1 Tax=Klenkia terrae TaxID=1052259 RepID=A0ABU8EDD4_9ACTN|nr:glycosyltransferase family 4 protein [Klenkia terrae]
MTSSTDRGTAPAPADLPVDRLSIAWVVAGGEGYGVARSVVNLMTEVRGLGATVTCLSARAGETSEEVAAAGLPLTVLDLPDPPYISRRGPGALRDAVRLLAWMVSFVRVARRHPALAGVTHLHVVSPALVPAGAITARLLGATCVWELTRPVRDSAPARLAYRLLARVLDVHVLANSRSTLSSLGVHGGRPAADVMHLSAADVFATVPDLVDAPLRAVCIARIAEDKAQDLLVEALADPRLADLALDLVGGSHDPVFQDRVRALVATSPARDRIRLLPASDHPETFLATASLAICVNRGVESFGLSVVEAMRAGRPVVATSSGGPSETVVDGETGWLMDTLDTAALADQLATVLDQRPAWAQMGRAARRRAEDRFSPAGQARRYLQLLARP